MNNIVVYFWAHYRLLYILFAVPALTLIFSFFIYPTVPRYFGGGKPVEVSIGLEPSFNETQIGVTNPFDAFLIYQSSDSLLVVINGGTYLLKQDDISYIKYLETNARIHALQELTTSGTTTAAELNL